MTKRILVFPCGSEIGLEIYRSICYSTHFELVGASSVDDHGRFVYEEYIGDVPYYNSPEFPEAINYIVNKYHIDAIYPAMDTVATTLKKIEAELNVIIIGSSSEVNVICESKKLTYHELRGVVGVPECFDGIDNVVAFPVFIKPDRGYGSRNTYLAENEDDARQIINRFGKDEMLLVENLPGSEWTVDCFSDRYGKLRFCGPRIRGRISNGISVNTRSCTEYEAEFKRWANVINKTLGLRGAWFFQVKLDSAEQPKLLEVASRLGGSSGLFRCKGVNFALLSLFDAFDIDVDITPNQYNIELDRALDNRYILELEYKHVFVDLDDCLIIRGELNRYMVLFLHKAVSKGKKITLITRHLQDPMITLKEYRISDLFDRVIHISDIQKKKSSYIDTVSAIFIDDSYAERCDVFVRKGLPVFSPDMIEALL
jgi:hypothetical protein